MKKFILFIFIFNSAIFAQFPNEIRLQGHFGDGIPSAVFLKDNIAYLCAGTLIKTIDYSDPANPKNLGELDLKDLYKSIFVENNRIYLLGKNLVVIDCTNPASLELLATFNISGQVFKVVNDIILISGTYEFKAIRITSDLNLETLDQINLFYNKEQIEYDGKFIYVVSAGGIYKVNAENFSDLKLTYFLETQPGFWIGGIALRDRYLYASCENRFIVYDTQSTDSLEQLKSLSIDYDMDKVVLRGNRAYVSNIDNGVYVIDVTDPASPVEVGAYSSEGVTDIFIDNNNVGWILHSQYSEADPIEIINTATVWPQLIRKMEVAESYKQICVYGNYVIASYYFSNNAVLIDFSTYNKPKIAAFITTDKAVRSMYLKDHFLYLVTSEWGKGELVIYDIADCNNPVFVSRLVTESSCREVIVDENYCYLSVPAGLLIINVTDVYNPRQIAAYISEFGTANNIAFDDNFIFLSFSSTHSNKIEIIDVSIPENPIRNAVFQLPGKYDKDMQINYPYLYIYNTNLGELYVYDFTDKSNIKLVGSYNIGSRYATDNILIKDGLVYCVTYMGVYSLDVSDVKNIKQVGRLIIPETVSMQLSDDKIYLVCQFTGVYLFSGNIVSVGNNTDKISFYNLNQNYPNPFNNSTVISYNVKTTGKVLIRIYNSLGQLIATPVNEYQSAGEHNIKFDASNYPSGVYIYNFSSGDINISRKMVLMK